jgi:LacI family transcriptional regulator
VGTANVHPGQACVGPGNVQIGALATDHFAELGLGHVAFFGSSQWHFGREIWEGLDRRASERGLSTHEYPGNPWAAVIGFPAEYARLRRWLAELPKPCGVLAITSNLAHPLVNICHEVGVDVPNELAICGVDATDPVVEMTSPALTAVDQGPRRMGYEAGRLLSAMMRGQSAPPGPVIVPPRRVVPRGSTNVLLADQPGIARAIRHVRAHALEPLTVAQVARHAHVSRRTVELGFRRNLGRTVYQEITRVRMEHARELLAMTDLAIDDIAVRVGLEWASSLTVTFKKVVGLTPTAYRKRYGTA